MKSRTPEEILGMDPKAIQRERLGKRVPRRTSYADRGKFTRDELVTFLREKDANTVRKMKAAREEGDPDEYDFRREFGSWQLAKEAAFGVEIENLLQVEKDRRYLVLAVVQYDLWTRKKWVAARKLRPDIFPSMDRVQKLFGCFLNLRHVTKRLSLVGKWYGYWDLCKKLGRKPTLRDCSKAALDVGYLVEQFGSKDDLDDFYSRLTGRDYEKSIRSGTEVPRPGGETSPGAEG